MTGEACRDRVGDLAAAALGRLTGDGEVRLRSHLDGCPACRAELAELQGAAAALDRADPARLDERVEPPAGLAAAIAASIAGERARHRRRRLRLTSTGLAAAAAAAALVAAVVGLVTSDGEADGGRQVAVAFTEAPAGTEAGATLVERGWGTEVRVELAGLEAGDVYWLWLSGGAQERVTAGTFTGVAGRARVVMAAAMPFSDVERVWVTDGSGDVVLDAELDE